jgi:hypothetical protein
MSNVRCLMRLTCPYCKSRVGVFSREWQAQRDVAQKRCPTCGGEVEATFSGKRYIVCLASFAGFSWLACAILHVDPAIAFATAMQGIALSLLPSLQLRASQTNQRGQRAWLYRRINLPAWLSPPAGLRKAARALGAIVSCVFAGVVAVVAFPEPWSGLLLVVAGVAGLASRRLWLSWVRLTGLGAQLLSAALLLAGIALLVARYA